MAVKISGPKDVPKRHRLPRASTAIAAACIIAVLGAAGVFLSMGLSEYSDMRQMVLTWTEIAETATGNEAALAPEFITENYEAGESAGEPVTVQSEFVKAEDMLYKAIDLEALQEINPDVSGYIYVPGTRINYPILKESEPEKYFYINHDIYKSYDAYGSIFELCDEERGEDSGIDWMFGHHMSSGAMFTGLYEFESPENYDMPIYVYREGYRSEYRAIGFCYVDKNDSAYAFGAYPLGSENYAELLSRLKSENSMKADRRWPNENGRLLVLSTCYGQTGTSRRMILLCSEVRRATVPEYYASLDEVLEYGGETEAVPVSDPRPIDAMDEILDAMNRRGE